MDHVVSHNELNVMFNMTAKCISQPQGDKQLYRNIQLFDGLSFYAKLTVLATDLAPRVAFDKKKVELEKRFPNAEHYN